VAEAAAVGALGPRPDAIFASSPPLPVGIPGALAARRYRCSWVFDVRDLWPEAAVSFAEDNVRERQVARLEKVLERVAQRGPTA